MDDRRCRLQCREPQPPADPRDRISASSRSPPSAHAPGHARDDPPGARAPGRATVCRCDRDADYPSALGFITASSGRVRWRAGGSYPLCMEYAPSTSDSLKLPRAADRGPPRRGASGGRRAQPAPTRVSGRNTGACGHPVNYRYVPGTVCSVIRSCLVDSAHTALRTAERTSDNGTTPHVGLDARAPQARMRSVGFGRISCAWYF